MKKPTLPFLIGLFYLASLAQAADKCVLSFMEVTHGVPGWGGTNEMHLLVVAVNGTEVLRLDVGAPSGKMAAEGEAVPLQSAGAVSLEVTAAAAKPVVTFHLTRKHEGCGTSPILLMISKVKLEKDGQPVALGKFRFKESTPLDLVPGTSPKNSYHGGIVNDTLVLSVGDDILTADPKEYGEHVIAAERAGHGNDFVVDKDEFGELTNEPAGQ
ncbi:MAG: hypothetical protein HY646_16075 [Acidobacteria bacterium]|nr:hypothetical protein [Acidobacteriota bacterium]